MNLPSDPLVAALRALEALQSCADVARARINDALIAQAPNTRTIAQSLEAKVHQFAPREDATGIPEADEPPSREPCT